jgi:hypothetical protein
MRRVARRSASVLPLVTIAVACSGESAAPLTPCDGPVAVSASHGTVPTLRWSPACLASRLVVNPLPPSQGFGWHWAVTAETELVAPGVQFGELPEGTSEDHQAWPLEEDEVYTVLLYDSEGTEIGRGEFTP